MIQIGKISLKNPLFLAAGCAKFPEDTKKILNSPSAALVVGSITTEPFRTDDGDIMWCDGVRSVTGFGFPNPGMSAWEAELPALASALRKVGKPLVVNVAGTTVDDYVNLAERSFAAGADVVEMNLGWPCLLSAASARYAFSDDPSAVAGLLQAAGARFRGKRGDLWLKFAPLQRTILEGMASAINAAGDAPVTAVVCSAPYPKTMFLEPDGSSVVGTDSFGQMSGEFLRPIALGQVRQFRALLPDNIALVGLGGVGIRAHVDQYLEMGASAVGFTTAYQIGGTEVFSYLFEEALAS